LIHHVLFLLITACDPESQKLYVIQEKNPMKIWSVDLVTGTFSEQIDVQGLESWSDQVTDLAGVSLLLLLFLFLFWR
jgi:uncharacterized protein YjiK